MPESTPMVSAPAEQNASERSAMSSEVPQSATMAIIPESSPSVDAPSTTSSSSMAFSSMWQEIRDYGRQMTTLTSGDLSSLSQLFFDNLSTILAALYFTQELKHSGVSSSAMNNILLRRITPGIGLSLCLGNTYHSYMAVRLAKQWKRPYTAQPFGINSLAAFTMVSNVMYPVFIAQLSHEETISPNEAFYIAYKVALAANFVTGLLSCVWGLFGPLILRVVPPAALLVPIAGVSIAFLGLQQLASSFAAPIVGFNAIFWVYLGWYAHVRVGIGQWRMPEALQVIVVGVMLGWATGLNSSDLLRLSAQSVGWIGPVWCGPEVFENIFELIQPFWGLILPMGITAPALTLMCLVSAKEAGDPYPVRETMIVDGLGTMLASLFGSPFGTVVYIGHAAHKRSGAQVGYSFVNGILFLLCSWFGILGLIQSIVNQATVGPIAFMIGLLVNEDVLDFIPPRHYAAYIFGIMPSIYDWVVNIAARTPIPDGASGAEYNTNLTGFSSWFGVLAFKRGSLLISMFWTAILVKTIDRKWTQVALWCTVAAVFSSLGVIHVPEAGVSQFTDSSWEQCDDVDECWQHAEQWTFMTAYLMMGATSLVVNAAKRCDSAIQDEIDDNSRPPFHDWFDNAAVPTELVANVDRANVRSYLPSLRDIQRYQHSALQDEETMPTTTATRSNHAEPP